MRRSAGLLAAAALAATIAAVAPPAAAAPSEDRDAFAYPDAALVQSLGEIAAGVGGDGGRDHPTVPGLGVTLGGVGSGAFILNQSGTFGPWHFSGAPYGEGNSQVRYQNRILPQAAFHVREEISGQPATLTTLATTGPDNAGTPKRSWGDPLPAWHLLDAGDADYAALYPFGWMSYDGFESDISLRFYSPMVPGDDKLTSLPVAYFDVRVTNPTDRQIDVSTMFTMPNVASSVAGVVPTVRDGLRNTAAVDATTGITSVTMAALGEGNTPDAYRSEWTIAARPGAGQNVSYVPSWNGDGDGSDVYDAFSHTGQLPDRSIDDSQSAGAIAVSATLAPGQSAVIPFALSWDFPQFSTTRTTGTGTSEQRTTSIWMRRYTEFYGARITDETTAEPGDYNRYIPGSYPFQQSRAIAEDALVNKDEWLARVYGWWTPLATDESVPAIVRTASLNQLSMVPFKSSLWAAGFVSTTGEPTLGHRLGSDTPGVRVFTSPDSAAGGNSQMGMDTGTYGYLAYNRFYPSIERDNLLAIAEGIERDPSGNPEAPYAGTDPYVSWVPGAPPVPGVSPFQDVPSKRIARFYAYATLHDDAEFLARTYPAMKRQFAWLQGMIPDGAVFPHAAQPGGPGNYFTFANSFNVIPVKGANAYDSLLYLLALEAMTDAGSRVGESEAVLQAWRDELAGAREAFDATFWDPENGWYRYTEYEGDGSAVLLDTFFAQHIAEQVGLPDLVDLDRYREHLANAYPVSLAAPDSDGRLVGARNLSVPSGAKTYPLLGTLRSASADFLTTPLQESSIWIGANYFAGSTYLNAGRRLGDEQLIAHGTELTTAVAEQVWGDLDNGFAFNPPEGWESDHWNRDGSVYIQPDGVERYTYAFYERSMATWEAYNSFNSIFDTVAISRVDLLARIQAAEALSRADHTEETWTGLLTALSAARATADDALATQSRIDEAAATLADAIAALVPLTAPVLTTATLVHGRVGERYRAVLEVSGTAPISFAVTTGGLPQGISLEAQTGTIAGLPSVPGDYTFVIAAENAQGTSEREYTVHIASASSGTQPGDAGEGEADGGDAEPNPGSVPATAEEGALASTGSFVPWSILLAGLLSVIVAGVLLSRRRRTP